VEGLLIRDIIIIDSLGRTFIYLCSYIESPVLFNIYFEFLRLGSVRSSVDRPIHFVCVYLLSTAFS
jgi:hypothetical protein